MEQDEVFVKNNCHNNCCSCCGECCTEFVPWTKKEIKIVKAYLNEHPEIKEQNKVRNGQIAVKCAFNDEKTHRCLIYPVRPGICKCFKCNQDFKYIVHNKDYYLKKGYVNKFDESDSYMGMSNLVSTHSMFFGNTLWDYDFVIAYAVKYSSLFKKDARQLSEELIRFFVILKEDN